MPRRAPIDPQGCYHVSSRGSYGQALYRRPEQYELFLLMYARVAKKYGWQTLDWVLMRNHHHFVIQLSDGGLSEGMRELHGGYSRRIHQVYGLTGQGHLVRHAFFARPLRSDADVLVTCRYVDMNDALATGRAAEATEWAGYRATVGLEHPRPFHAPSALLSRISSSPAAAQRAWVEFVHEGLAEKRRGLSPNDGLGAA